MLSKELYLNQSILARMIKTSNEIGFYKLVHDALYENKEKDETLTIKAIMSLCEPTYNGGINTIVTYNFDDLLERNLEKRKIKYEQRPTAIPARKDYLPIYHVHGFLPRILDEKKAYHIVFSEDEYHKQFSELDNSNTNMQQNLLENSTCLYVGISFTDPNMRRVADTFIKRYPDCKNNPRHYLIKQRLQKKSEGWEHPFLSEEKVLEQIMFLEELDAESFGFRIIWLNDYNEIEQLFNDIREWKH